MTVNYHKLSQVVTPIAAVIPDVVLLPEQINTSHGNWYVAIDLKSAFFFLESAFFPSISVNRTTSSSFLSAGKSFTVLALKYITLKPYVVALFVGILVTFFFHTYHIGPLH